MTSKVNWWLTRTAGTVLLWEMLPAYLERLNVVTGGVFRDDDQRARAPALLHYLATGQTQCAESQLVLAKLLCGVAPETPVLTNVDVNANVSAVTEDLIAFVLSRWSAVGVASPDGFRGSFLCRDGQLSRGEDRWTLDVEPRTYDLLLDSFPFPISIVKTPWMTEPLFVRWRK